MFGKIINYIKSKEMVVLSLILLCLISLIFEFSIYGRFDHDEFEAIHTAWKILNGQVIFIDFFQQKNPFFHYTLIPILQLFKETTDTLVASRIYIFATFFGSLSASFLIAKNVFDKKTALVSTILLASSIFFVSKAVEIRPDTLQVLFGLLSIMFLYVKFPSRPKLSLVLSGFFLALSFVVLQKAVFFVLMTLILLLFRLKEKRVNFKDIVIYFSVFIVTVIPFYLYIFSFVSPEKYYVFNWIVNTKFLGGFSPSESFCRFFSNDAFLWLFFLVGLFNIKGEKQKELAFIAIFALFHVLFIRTPNMQYFMMAIPFMSMIGANLICRSFNQNLFVLLLLLAFPVFSALLFFTDRAFNHGNYSQLLKIDYVLFMTEKDDLVYDGNIDFNLFRNDIDFFWFGLRENGVLQTYKTCYKYDYDVYKSIAERRPKIISTYGIPDMENSFIKKHYEKSPAYDDLYIMVK